MKKKIIFIITFILVILVIALVFNKKLVNFIFFKKQAYNSTAQINDTASTSKLIISPSLEELNEIEKTSINKSDWQTYKNDYYGFEIKAPKFWGIKLSNKTGALENANITDPSLSNFLSFLPNSNDQFYAPLDLTVEDNPDDISITDWMLKKDPANHSRWQEGLIQLEIPTTEGAAAFFVSMYDNEGIYRYAIKKNKKIYSFNMVDSNQDLKNGDAMMYAIVKTLRFK